MSGTTPNNHHAHGGRGRGKGQFKQNQAQAAATNVMQTRLETPSSYDDNFPTLHEAASNQTATGTASTNAPPSRMTPPQASNTYQSQNFVAIPSHPQAGLVQMATNMQPLMVPAPMPPQYRFFGNPSVEQRPPVFRPFLNVPPRMPGSNPTMTHTTHSPQPTNTNSNTVTINDPSPASTAAPVRPLSGREIEVNIELCRIILTIHESKEFVSLEKVERQLFSHFHVTSWRELRVHPLKFDALTNLEERLKNVTFYLHIFEQTFNLCTLHDFEPYLVEFLKVKKYNDLRLGPLHEHPEVQRVFKYRPTNSDQPILSITTGEVIQRFMDFQKEHRHQRMVPFDEFLDKLVKIYDLQSHHELGIFCKSWAYLKQVIGNVRRDQESHLQETMGELEEELTKQARTRLDELKEEMKDVAHFSSFNQKKTPTAVFNYLTSIVEKELSIVPHQPIVYGILVQLREDEILRCLLNISIYLGMANEREEFIAELKELCGRLQTALTTQQLSILGGQVSKKDRKKINAMIQQQQQSQAQSLKTQLDDQITTVSAPVNTSFTSSLTRPFPTKPKPPISLKELCSDIYTQLIRYDTILTIDQFLEIDERLCSHHNVTSFSAFSYDDVEDDDKPVNFVLFLHKHRRLIDPHDQLSVYEHTASSGDQTELYSFVQQLSALHNDEVHDEHQQQHVRLVHGHVNAEQRPISAEKISAVEKAVKHKFGPSVSFRKGNQLITKAKQRLRKHKTSIIRYEESLMDVHGLDRLDICPTSMNVDESQLCQLILDSPLMTDLHTWLQWHHFFQPKYGALKSFIDKHEKKFRDLRLLETSNQELVRLPIDVSLSTFEQELNSMQIRNAVGHLCALIIQGGLVTQFSFNVYRTSMIAWFRHLRSSITLQNEHVDPMQYILEFLMYLPELIGQSRILEELVLRSLDEVFGNDRVDGMNTRTRIWNLADKRQRIKLEIWGYTVNIVEWQNKNKWLGHEDSEDRPNIQSENGFAQGQNLRSVDPHIPMSPTIGSVPTSPLIKNPLTPPVASALHLFDGNESAQAAFDHIEAIRRGFGVNSGLDSNGQSIVTNLQGMIARSLDKLSTDLYSDQGHFVLELIQNADDNHYTSDRLPTLRFILAPERILVCNNEVGFQSENIAAICNVGASTKGKHKQGYAGHKGIGFKSVFMVSHRPEIHSRNYHLRFDTVDGTEQIGYIRPIWLDELEEKLPNLEEWTTSIRLPVKKETQRDRLQQNFDDIQARLLLFLNRLRQIEIIYQENHLSLTNNTKRVFTRIDHAGGEIIELQEKTLDKPMITNFWLVCKEVIKVPNDIKIKLRDVKGEVNSTTIAIAYPLSGIQESSNQLPPVQPLFAYLPLRPYGFRFILQGDFEIPATRQEIRRDNLWNEWLKTEMTLLLSRAYHQFQRLPDLLASSSINTQINTDLTPIQITKYFLKLIPSRNELDPYFNSFIDKSIEILMGDIKLPVARLNENNEAIIDWISPSRCMIVRDPLIRKILSQDLLLSHFNCYYVHEQLALECDEQILVKLGCRQLEFTDIIQLIESSYKQGEQQHPKTTSSIEQVAQWLVCLDYSLEEQRNEMHHPTHEKETIAKLKQLKIIPLKQQSYFVSVDQFDKQGISFPLDKKTQFSKHLKFVLDDVPTLDEQLLEFIEDKHPRRLDSIKRLLQKLGIRDALNIREIYRQHILPVMADSTRWSTKSESILMAYLLCIYEYIYLPYRDTFDNDSEILRKTMVVKTRDNKFVSLGSPNVVVHLPSTYNTRMSLDSLKLSKYKFTFISDDYYKLFRTEISHQEKDIYDFISFLKELHINDFFQVDSINKPFIQVSQLADTQWAYLIRSLSEMIYEPFKIKDFSCEEFNKLVSPTEENPTPDRDLCIQLLQYLDRHHQSAGVNYVASIVLARGDKYGQGTTIKGFDSSFCLSLRQQAWIPVDGDLLYKPHEVYLLPPNSDTSAFRRYVPHLDTSKVSLRSEDFVYKILGMKPTVTHQTMFELLMKWSCNLDSESLWKLVQETNPSEPIPCTLPSTFRQTCLDSIDNFHQIYLYLASNPETCQLLNRFRLWPLIFIPRDQQTGDFIFAHQTFWNDPISLLSSQNSITDSKGRISIQSYYGADPRLEPFFLRVLHVEQQPTIDDYLPLLSTFQDLDKIWQIIQIITKLTVEQNKQKEVREQVRGIAFIPCMNNQKKLAKYTDHPFYPHDMDIVTLFVDTVPIIRLPSFNLSPEFIDQFCLLFDIENLRNVIKTKINVDNEQPSISLTDFYRSSIDLIQNFLLSKRLISDDRSAHLSTIFSRMKFICVDRIHLSYCYGADTIKTPSTSYSTNTYVDDQTSKFYILKKFETSEMRYTDAMVHFIVEDEILRAKLSSYVKELLQVYQNEGGQGLANRRENITEKYEPKWTIPQEKKDEVPVAVVPIQEPEKPISKKPEISDEKIQKLMDEPSVRSKRPPQMTSTVNPTPPGSDFLPPLPTNKAPSEQKPDNLSGADHPPSSSSSQSISSANDQNHQAPQDRERERNEAGHVVRERTMGDFIDGEKSKKEPTEDNTQSSENRVSRPHAPIIPPNFTAIPPPIFDQIAISTLANFDLLTSVNSSPPPPGTEADVITGRLGEELVFQYLKNKHPTETITWMNEKDESFQPYDILRNITSENAREEFIEVKTTRTIDHHTFPISINEVNFLLHHPSNYFIYRVYYGDPIKSSTITVISKVKHCLQLQHIKLNMIVPAQNSD